MVHFTRIKATGHYIREHEQDVSWDKVVELIFSTKNPRKKKGKFEIEKDSYYVLFEITDNTLYIINAKKK